MCFRQGIAAGLVLGCFSNSAIAEGLLCSGRSPDWEMKTSGTEAMFSYLNKNIRFEVRLSTEAEGGAGPMAHTLISDFDTAILLVDEIPCSTGADMTGYVLTQDRDLPILLSGCCSPAKQ